jgi:battenin
VKFSSLFLELPFHQAKNFDYCFSQCYDDFFVFSGMMKAVYQISAFIGKSSVNVVPVKRLWIFPALQLANFSLLFLHALFLFIPNVWFIFGIIFWEG